MRWRLLLARRGEALLLLAALLLAALAWLRPHLSLHSPTFSFLMIFDITQSMNTRDQPAEGGPAARLQAAKDAARQTMLDLPCGSRIGLAIFSEYRTLTLIAPVEVCENFADLTAALGRIDGRMSWAGASEIAKGLGFALRTQKALNNEPHLVFFTDGHEAPPIDPRFRTRLTRNTEKGASGIIVGAGGGRPVPIPKTAPDGSALGFWRADEVLQVDPRALGRGGSIDNEGTVDELGNKLVMERGGKEHLSSLHETHLKQLAQEAGLSYVRLGDPHQTSAALRTLEPGKIVRTRVAVDWLPALAALGLLLAYLFAGWLLPQR